MNQIEVEQKVHRLIWEFRESSTDGEFLEALEYMARQALATLGKHDAPTTDKDRK